MQYDQYAVACTCGRMHTAARPEGAGAGRIEYGPQLRAFVLYLIVVHYCRSAEAGPTSRTSALCLEQHKPSSTLGFEKPS